MSNIYDSVNLSHFGNNSAQLLLLLNLILGIVLFWLSKRIPSGKRIHYLHIFDSLIVDSGTQYIFILFRWENYFSSLIFGCYDVHRSVIFDVLWKSKQQEQKITIVECTTFICDFFPHLPFPLHFQNGWRYKPFQYFKDFAYVLITVCPELCVGSEDIHKAKCRLQRKYFCLFGLISWSFFKSYPL